MDCELNKFFSHIATVSLPLPRQLPSPYHLTISLFCLSIPPSLSHFLKTLSSSIFPTSSPACSYLELAKKHHYSVYSYPSRYLINPVSANKRTEAGSAQARNTAMHFHPLLSRHGRLHSMVTMRDVTFSQASAAQAGRPTSNQPVVESL